MAKGKSNSKQDHIIDNDPMSQTGRTKLRALGDEDQTLRRDPFYEDWYQYDEDAEPKLPPDFSERLAIHIIVLLERHTTQESIERIDELLSRHVRNPKMYVILCKTLRFFLHRAESINHLNTVWLALMNEHKATTKLPHNTEWLTWLIQDFKINRARNHYTDPNDRNISFSFLGSELGDNLISLNDGSHSLDNTRNIYSLVINLTLEELDIAKELSNKDSMLINNNYQDSYELPYFERFLFNDIYQYVEYRTSSSGQLQYATLGISHQVDNIKYLLRSLTSIRNQVVQSIINEKVMKRNKEIRKKLKTRSLTDEDLVASTPIFKEILFLYYLEKRYKFDYVSLDLVRNFARISAMLMGVIAVLYSFIDTSFMSLTEGVSTFIIMCVFALATFPKKYFTRFYPKKKPHTLKKSINDYMPYFGKMSREQLINFCKQQIKLTENKDYFYLIPELVIYIHGFLPSRTNKLATIDDIRYVANQLQQICDVDLN
ncbi:MAG: hypothetical protein JJV97_00775 [SAR324 cluster bacterium]|nr:hypothetical protein [SAR324 cluster bacterium]